MVFREIDPPQIYDLEPRILVDVRSPAEFEEFHVPGAVNLPLFENDEKELIGYVYRNRGKEDAKKLGERIARSKLTALFEKLSALKERYGNVVVYCWRGGMRSTRLCEVMAQMGLNLYRLRGGYRAYRRFILADMERILKGTRMIVLTGKTGVGKTALIRRLREEGIPAIDLEGLAGDRGSVFGGVGGKRQVSQKMFDSLLYEDLRDLGGGVIFVEDESRRVGRIQIPDPFWRRKCEGLYVEIKASLEKRVRNILEEYTASPGWQEEVLKALPKIAKYLGPQRYSLLKDLIERGEAEEAIRLLIEEYYDRKYRRFGEPVATISADDPQECLRSLRELYNYCVNEGKVPDPHLQR